MYCWLRVIKLVLMESKVPKKEVLLLLENSFFLLAYFVITYYLLSFIVFKYMYCLFTYDDYGFD